MEHDRATCIHGASPPSLCDHFVDKSMGLAFSRHLVLSRKQRLWHAVALWDSFLQYGQRVFVFKTYLTL